MHILSVEKKVGQWQESGEFGINFMEVEMGGGPITVRAKTLKLVPSVLLTMHYQVLAWYHKYNKANLRDLLAATGLVILLKLDSNRRFFSPCDLENWWMTSKNYKTWVTVRKHSIRVKNQRFIVPCDLKIWRITLKNYRAPLLCCFKLCASFHSHRWIQTKVTVPKHSIRVKIGDLLSRVTLKFDEWPWKTIGHLFYVASSFLHHFIAIGDFKLKLQSGNAQFGSNATLFRAVWPWNLMDDLQKQ